ncbi:MAG: hypothetical protein K2M97_04540, partial [Muribaculaceae bacterium]|nr:hypothetical protein [Muribaculaceae bacterium]
MKLRISAIFAMICFMAASVAAQMLPQFSTEAAPAWYFVQFNKDSHTLADKGNGQVLRTANKSSVDAQKWQLIGTEKSFIMKSKAGNYVTYNGSRYASTNSAASATALTLSQGASGCWSISRTTATGTGMNQWGGTSVNAEIGDYDVLDVNNALH